MKRDDQKYLEGNWSENISWEFYLSDFLPQRELCTAVFVLLKHKGKIVLTKTHRGWEMPGGHIEKNETLEEALQREVIEETGAQINRFKLIGYRKIISKKPDSKNIRNANYPFPYSYIPHYLAVTETEFFEPTGDENEVIEAGEFLPEELSKLNSDVMPIMEVCLQRLNDIN